MSSSHKSWRIIFKNYLAGARVDIFRQILSDEVHLKVNSHSKILMSNIDTAVKILDQCAKCNEEKPSLPTIVVAQRLAEPNEQYDNAARCPNAISVVPMDQLRGNDFTHAFLHIHTSMSDRDLSDLLRHVYQLLGSNGKLILSRRKRDGFADILHAAGAQVPGRQQESNVPLASDQDIGLEFLVAEAGFPRTETLSLEKSYRVMQCTSDTSLGDAKSGLVSDLGACDDGTGWKARFDAAANRELAEHGGVLLVANVVMATNFVDRG